MHKFFLTTINKVPISLRKVKVNFKNFLTKNVKKVQKEKRQMMKRLFTFLSLCIFIFEFYKPTLQIQMKENYLSTPSIAFVENSFFREKVKFASSKIEKAKEEKHLKELRQLRHESYKVAQIEKAKTKESNKAPCRVCWNIILEKWRKSDFWKKCRRILFWEKGSKKEKQEPIKKSIFKDLIYKNRFVRKALEKVKKLPVVQSVGSYFCKTKEKWLKDFDKKAKKYAWQHPKEVGLENCLKSFVGLHPKFSWENLCLCWKILGIAPKFSWKTSGFSFTISFSF